MSRDIDKRKKYNHEYYIKTKEKRREYDLKHKDELKEYRSNYYLKHKVILKELSSKRYYKKRDFYIKAVEEYKKNHPEMVQESVRRYRLKYPERHKAYWYTWSRKQRGNVCEECGSTENLEFHHTNYKRRKGVTLCHACHMKKDGRTKSWGG